MSARRSMVVGSGGQDGRYLCTLLGNRGDQVAAIERGGLDLGDRGSVERLLSKAKPDEVYYLAGVFGSSESPAEAAYRDYQRCHEVHVLGWLNFLDAVAAANAGTRLFYASSSRIFGSPDHSPQSELTPHAPRCIYGITKSAGMHLGRFYRERGVRCSSGILYNHESPRRPANFVSRKIVRAAVDIKLGASRKLTLGNLSAAVDWGAAQDYVEAMVLILERAAPADYVIATGELHTVGQFVEAAFSALGLPSASHVDEDRSLITVAPAERPLVGDSSRLREATGWRPRMSFEDMVKRMVEAELSLRRASVA